MWGCVANRDASPPPRPTKPSQKGSQTPRLRELPLQPRLGQVCTRFGPPIPSSVDTAEEGGNEAGKANGELDTYYARWRWWHQPQPHRRDAGPEAWGRRCRRRTACSRWRPSPSPPCHRAAGASERRGEGPQIGERREARGHGRDRPAGPGAAGDEGDERQKEQATSCRRSSNPKRLSHCTSYPNRPTRSWGGLASHGPRRTGPRSRGPCSRP